MPRPWTAEEDEIIIRGREAGKCWEDIQFDLWPDYADRTADGARIRYSRHLRPQPTIKRLFFDIETSPCLGFFWRPGHKISISHENIVRESAIICICWSWEHEDKVSHAEWQQGDDKQAVEEFLEIALQADELIAHNGDRFDMPWVNTRCVKHGLGPVPKWKTIDTLKISRRLFTFPSNRLDYLGKYFFGEGKIHADYSLWRDIVLDNCPKAMNQMVKYCKQDVRLLKRVWERLHGYYAETTHAGVLGGKSRWTCPHDGSENVKKSKTNVTAAGTIQHQMKCKDCGKYYTVPEHVFRDYAKVVTA